MFGKHFESMYDGSMIGKGSAFFAVWGYVIAKQKPSRRYGSIVELNPSVVAFLLGEKEKVVSDVIEQMCQPDPKSRTKKEQGKRLVRLDEYSYRVVNGAKYRAIRDEESRRDYQRQWQRENRKNISKETGELEPKNDPYPPLPPGVKHTDRGEAFFKDAVQQQLNHQSPIPEVIPDPKDHDHPNIL